MDFVLKDGYHERHERHDGAWTVYSPHHGCPVCLGCIVETVENTQLLPLQRKPALSEMLRLLTNHASEVLQLFMQEERIVWHIVTILIENLQIEDEPYVSLSVDTTLKLIQQVGSDDLVTTILDNITEQVRTLMDHRKLLPHYTLLGKMLYQLPALAPKLLTDYVELLHALSLDLCNAGETIQSAIAYIFILVCDPSYNSLVSPRFLHQVHCGTLSMLAAAQTLSVQINGLGLLKKLLIDDEGCTALMSLNKDGTSVLTSIKKLLLSKKDVLQIGVGQILAQLLGKQESKQYGAAILDSDIAEFLFEALHTQNTVQMECVLKVLHQLASVDQFYKRCHAVYGIESVLRALTTAEELKNPTLLRLGYSLLAEMLRRQPTDIPLFVSANMVNRCLSLIKSGVIHHQASISSRSLEAFTAMLRSEHLLVPVPFSDLTELVVMVSGQMWNLLKDTKRLSVLQRKKVDQEKLKDSGNGDDSLRGYLHMMLNSCQLALQCKTDRTSCASNFAAQGAGGDQGSTLQMFVHAVLKVADETCIPLIMINWDGIKTPDVYCMSLQLLCWLHDLDAMATCDLVYKLVQTGFLTTVIDVKVTHSDMRLTEICGQFLHLAMQCCQSKGLIPDHVSTDIIIKMEHMQWCFSTVGRAFTGQDICVDSIQGYLLVLYLCYSHNNRILGRDELQGVLSSVVETHTSLEQLSPLARKHYLYLLAWACVHDGMPMRTCIPSGVQSLPAILRGPREEWYSHNIIMLQWGFSDIVIATVSGEILLDAYLEDTTVDTLQQYFENEVHPDDDEGNVLLQLCENQQFVKCLLTSLATQCTDNVTKIVLILETFTHNQSITGKGGYQSVTDTEEYQSINDTGVYQSFTDIEEYQSNNDTGVYQSFTDTSGETTHDKTEQYIPGEATPENTDHTSHMVDKVTDVLQNVFLKNFPTAADHNVVGLLQVMLMVSRYRQPYGNYGNIHVKILYHVMNLLGRKTAMKEEMQRVSAVTEEMQRVSAVTEEMQRVCMLTVLAAVSDMNKADNQVCAMVVQHEGVMDLLQHCVQEDTGMLYCIANDILTALIQQTNLKGSCSCVTVDLHRLIHSVCQCRGDIQTASLNLLASLFGVNLTSSVIKTSGRISPAQYRTLYIYLQQLLVQDVIGIHEPALECMVNMIKYVHCTQPTLGHELLSQPWNKVLLDVTFDLCTETSTFEQYMTLMCLFTEYQAGCELMKSSPALLRKLLTSLTGIREEEVFVSATSTQLKNRLLSQITKNFVDHLTQSEVTQIQKRLS